MPARRSTTKLIVLGFAVVGMPTLLAQPARPEGDPVLFEGARLITGRTVMPALVDVHTHLGYRSGATFRAENFSRDTIVDELNRFAYFGVAAVGSAGTDRGDLTLRLRNDPHPGAVVRTAWRGLAPPDAGPNPPMRDAPYGVSSESEARQDVRELAARKVDFVKIWVDDRVLDANPLDNIANTRRIARVFMRGAEIRRLTADGGGRSR
jgi:hypothetical protein